MGWDPFKLVLLITRFLLSMLPCTHCLPSWSTTSSLVCEPSSPSPFYFKTFLSRLTSLLSKILLPYLFKWILSFPSSQWSLKRVHGCKSQIFLVSTSCASRYWLVESIHSSSPFPSVAGLGRKPPGPPCPWHSPLEPYTHTWCKPCPSSHIVDAYVEEQQRGIVSGPDKPQQPLHNILDLRLGKQQATLDSSQVSRWGPLSPAAGSLPLLSLITSSRCCCGAQAQLSWVLGWTQLPVHHILVDPILLNLQTFQYN